MLSPRSCWLLAFVALAVVLFAGGASNAGDFVNYESAHVHPISLSDSGRRLYAVNTPEARLSIFRVARKGKLTFLGDVPVGLEPVSLAVRPDTDEVWVANHLSDSVSVVDGSSMTLIATLQVGDEPTDIAFASGRAFISLAGNQDRVVVYDADSRELITSLEIFGDDPRALAVTPDGKRVALVVLESGNGTTTIHHSQYSPLRMPPLSDPPRAPFYPPGIPEQPLPREPLIVQHEPGTGMWLDDAGGDWSDLIFFGSGATMPDHDLFWIDAAADPPFVTDTVRRVGTNLFDVEIHPTTGEAWVPNTDADNVIRFEPILRGHLVETRVSIVDPDLGMVDHVDINPHIDRSVTPGPEKEIALSLAIPGDGEFDRRGRRYYMTAFGSAKVAVLDGRSGKVLKRIEVAGGPSGLALHRRAARLYVMQRFSNTITIVNTRRGKAVGSIGVSGPHAFDPSPQEIQDGRRFLYDAQLSSGHGDISCATCHVFGNFDGLGWDLGDPQGDFIPFADAPWLTNLGPTTQLGFDPMKGPMTTQSLRGLEGTEPFHWRGDRANFQHFNGAFVSLLGRDAPLDDDDMDAFTDFILTVKYPPNPNRLLDDSLPRSVPGHGNPRVGFNIFKNVPVAAGNRVCTSCHRLPLGTSLGVLVIADQATKIPHLRNVYEKLGRDRFGESDEDPLHRKGGFGIFHHGSLSLVDFLSLAAGGLEENQPDMTAFLSSFSTGTFPCVGRQVTVDRNATLDQLSTLDVLIGQAGLSKCDVVAKGRAYGEPAGFLYDPASAEMQPDSSHASSVAPRDLVDGFEPEDLMTFMGVPHGSGERLGLDRDRDGCMDGDESRQQTDPANPGTPMPDSDGDGLPDSSDSCPGWVQQDHSQPDRNRNGTPNECECGDVSDDGRVNWKDVRLLWYHLRGYGKGDDLALEKCNVSGPAGNDPELCTEADLYELFRHVWKKSRRWRSEQTGLEPRCLPEVPTEMPPTMICVD